MDKNDEELRESIVKLWPLQGPKMHTLLVPPNEGNHLSCSCMLLTGLALIDMVEKTPARYGLLFFKRNVLLTVRNVSLRNVIAHFFCYVVC